MVNRHTALKIRKTHRYLGLFLGIQFLFWTISGLYFSWTNIDEIHGDQFKNLKYQPKAFNSLISPSEMDVPNGIKTIELRDIDNAPYYWINKEQLYNALDGMPKNKQGYFRLLETNKRVILPTNTHLRLLVSAADVLHS